MAKRRTDLKADEDLAGGASEGVADKINHEVALLS
jgi:hypothetical protein